MENLNDLIHHDKLRYINHTQVTTIFHERNRALISFAIDDAIATTVGEGIAPPTVRLWVHPPTIVLGIPDSRLPYLQEGVQFLKEQNYQVVIRNSGGLAVLLDQGVLNMSLILPSNDQLSIHDGYDIMYRFIQFLFKSYTKDIKAYEIKGSYCPGDYDLSVNGIKFAGISQRRVRSGVAVQIYIDIEGNSQHRASIVKAFYDKSIQGEQTKYHYPTIKPNVMGSLHELLDPSLTVSSVIHQIEKSIMSEGKNEFTGWLLPKEKELFTVRLEQMYKRNKHLATS